MSWPCSTGTPPTASRPTLEKALDPEGVMVHSGFELSNGDWGTSVSRAAGREFLLYQKRDPLGSHATWRDRLSADAVRNPVIAELIAQCQRCGNVVTIEIGGSPTRWVISHRDITRDERLTWRHRQCRGRLRFHGKLPKQRPTRIVLEGDPGPGRPG